MRAARRAGPTHHDADRLPDQLSRLHARVEMESSPIGTQRDRGLCREELRNRLGLSAHLFGLGGVQVQPTQGGRVIIEVDHDDHLGGDSPLDCGRHITWPPPLVAKVRNRDQPGPSHGIDARTLMQRVLQQVELATRSSLAALTESRPRRSTIEMLARSNPGIDIAATSTTDCSISSDVLS
jgi:hypothetical protein